MTILSMLESTSLDWTFRSVSKWFIKKTPKNLELVSLKCVTYGQPIPLSLNQSLKASNGAHRLSLCRYVAL